MGGLHILANATGVAYQSSFLPQLTGRKGQSCLAQTGPNSARENADQSANVIHIHVDRVLPRCCPVHMRNICLLNGDEARAHSGSSEIPK